MLKLNLTERLSDVIDVKNLLIFAFIQDINGAHKHSQIKRIDQK